MWPFGRSRQDLDLGRRGEQLARRFLKHKGLRPLAENYRCPAGEADLIALDRTTGRSLGAETLVFVEVKTRVSDRHTGPESAVNADKKRRLKKVANYYLAQRDTEGFLVRFDIVAIVIAPGREPRIRHIEDAFR